MDTKITEMFVAGLMKYFLLQKSDKYLGYFKNHLDTKFVPYYNLG